jgi:hypothetical protein
LRQPKCEVCKQVKTTKGSIVGDNYYQHICNDCYNELMVMESPSSASADYDRSRDAEDNEQDLIQPYSGGKISVEFIHLYPERARQMWSAEEIDQATRS